VFYWDTAFNWSAPKGIHKCKVDGILKNKKRIWKWKSLLLYMIIYFSTVHTSRYLNSVLTSMHLNYVVLGLNGRSNIFLYTSNSTTEIWTADEIFSLILLTLQRKLGLSMDSYLSHEQKPMLSLLLPLVNYLKLIPSLLNPVIAYSVGWPGGIKFSEVVMTEINLYDRTTQFTLLQTITRLVTINPKTKIMSAGEMRASRKVTVRNSVALKLPLWRTPQIFLSSLHRRFHSHALQVQLEPKTFQVSPSNNKTWLDNRRSVQRASLLSRNYCIELLWDRGTVWPTIRRMWINFLWTTCSMCRTIS
jgi:WD40 repeat protein